MGEWGGEREFERRCGERREEACREAAERDGAAVDIAAEPAGAAVRPSTDEPEERDGESRLRVWPPAPRLCERRGVPDAPSVGDESAGAAFDATTPRTLRERDSDGMFVVDSEWLPVTLGVAAFAGLDMPLRERVVAIGTDCGV